MPRHAQNPSRAPWPAIERAIAVATRQPFRIERRSRTGGGSISDRWTIEGGGHRYFLKLDAPAKVALFEAEAAGLAALAHTGAVRVPRPVACGADSAGSWLVLEHLALAPRDGASDAALGRALARVHAHTRPLYGWERDNSVGATLQLNGRLAEWPLFWCERRLAPQLALAARHGYAGRLGERGAALTARVPALLDGHRPAASLLHGDLWSGNAARDENGAPVLFDPAVYYGDRETDLAMTELFGGFSDAFYAAYCQVWPLDRGYATRKTLYNLYHVLNHANLFGGGYVGEAERMIDRLLTQSTAL